jgi:hypothetical protein
VTDIEHCALGAGADGTPQTTGAVIADGDWPAPINIYIMKKGDRRMTSANSFFTTKGLFVRRLNENRYTVHDVFGTSSLPFTTKNETELVDVLLANFKIRPLVDVQNLSEFPNYSEFSWNQLEYYYVAHLDYALHTYLMTEPQSSKYQAEKYFLPVAYLELGHGDGARRTLELIDRTVRDAIAKGTAPFSAETLETWLVINQFGRICSEIMSLISRAIASFIDLLKAQRSCIINSVPSISQLRTNEVIHHGRDSYAAATAASMSAISMCTSLDLLSKLIHYLDQLDPKALKFKAAGGCHFSDLTKLNAGRVPKEIGNELMLERRSNADIAELIQFRHDVVHSTSALELEKVYVGIATAEINDMPLYYSFQGWRDCLPNGQPERYLGRDFFIEKHQDIEQRLFTWLQSVISLQLRAGKRIHEYLLANKMD